MTQTSEPTTVDRVREAAATRALRLAVAFVAWNAVFFVITLVELGSVADDAVGAVLLRAVLFTAAGPFLVLLARRMRRGLRSGWFRLTLISTLAPIGVVVFIIFQPDLPLWFVVGQLGSALMLVGIAATDLQKHVRDAYPKTSDSPAASDAAESLADA